MFLIWFDDLEESYDYYCCNGGDIIINFILGCFLDVLVDGVEDVK